jgi:hypothetical protein
VVVPPELGIDARKWALEFQSIAKEKYNVTLDEAWLIGWFANAIMAGFDEGGRRASEAMLDAARARREIFKEAAK